MRESRSIAGTSDGLEREIIFSATFFLLPLAFRFLLPLFLPLILLSFFLSRATVVLFFSISFYFF